MTDAEAGRPEVVRVSERAFLVRFDEGNEEIAARRVHALLRLFDSHPPGGLVSLLPAASSLLVEGDGRLDAAALERLVCEAGGPRPGERPARTHLLEVAPGGPDLGSVLETTGLAEPRFWTALEETRLVVAFVGFSPGFAYLAGLPPLLRVPRRPAPRPRVPAGSLALGGPYAGIYPSATPGGWNLVGRCERPLFDPRRDPPALLATGDVVRLRLLR